jgi:hypothetical protein
MAEITSTNPARKRATGFLASVALVALYSFGAVAVTGVASIAGASTALAQYYYYRGRGRGVRGNRGVTASRTTFTKKRGYGYRHNKGSSIELSSGGPSGQTRGVGSSFDRRGAGVGSSGGADFGDRRGDDVRRDSGRDYAGPARGSGDAPRGTSTSRTVEDSRRAADIESCARQYRSYDRETMTYTDYNGRRQSCP